MDEDLSFDVSHRGENISLTGRIARVGYVYKILVKVGEFDVAFEPDEERNYRAIIEGDASRLGARENDIIRQVIEQLDAAKG